MKKRIVAAVSVIIATLFIVCVAVIISNPWRYRRIYQPMDVTEEEFLSKMKKLDEYCQTTFYEENGEILFKFAQEKQYDKYFIPALIYVEAGAGKYTNGSFNYWDAKEWAVAKEFSEEEYINIIKIERYRNFETLEDSLKYFSENIMDKYYCEKYTYEEFSRKWAPSTAENPNFSEQYAKNLYKVVKRIENL